MDKIIKFLKEHPLINRRALEKKAGIPYGSIRLSYNSIKNIPLKYKDQLENALKDYGFIVFRLGGYEYSINETIHFEVNSTIVEARIVWSDPTYSYVLQPTGRTEWVAGCEIIVPERSYLD